MLRLAPPALLLAATLLVLPGCVSDESSTPRRTQGPASAAAEQQSSDAGSRFLEVGGPVGGLTEETPPVVGRYAGPAVTGR